MNETMKETAAREFVMTREFNAPRDLVFKAWTEADRLEQWWGPKGVKTSVSELELRPGGLFHYCMHLPDGQQMWGRFIYRDIEAPERVEYVVSFSDEKGGIARAPFSQTWPLELLNTVTFTEKNGKTTLTTHAEPVNATEEERKTFEANFDSLKQGSTSNFDQLEEYLAKQSK